MIHSTICLHPDSLACLNKLAVRYKCSRNVMILKLLNRNISVQTGIIRTKRNISYQERTASGISRIHIFLPDDMYELCLDLRKFSKRSLSLIIAEEIRKEIEESTLKKNDNYQFHYEMKSLVYYNRLIYYIVNTKEKPSKNKGSISVTGYT